MRSESTSSGEALELFQSAFAQSRVRPIVDCVTRQLGSHAHVGQALPQFIVGLQVGQQLGLGGFVQIIEDQGGQ